MISKAITAITKPDIDALVQNQVREGRTNEYKLVLPGNSDDEKREFLADISSFANAGGGDLLYGIRADDGVPQEAVGLACNIDTEIQRLESLMRDCLDPRIPGVRIAPIEGFPQGSVLLVRIPRSWASPHMIAFKNLSRFFTRNSAGKHQMDVTEIRSAFLLSESLPEKIKAFRDKRLGRIVACETPLPLCEGAKLVIHILPVPSFSSDFRIAMSTFKEEGHNFKPMDVSGWDYRFNLDGYLTFSINRQDACCRSYCQIFRGGQVEAVSTCLVEGSPEKPYIASVAFERGAIMAVHQYLTVLAKLEVPSPVIIFISLLDVLGVNLAVKGYFSHDPAPIDRDTLLLPDILIDEYETLTDAKDTARTLRPVFDALWNACGYECSYSYDKDGKWNPDRR
jgi:hypothetical protein